MQKLEIEGLPLLFLLPLWVKQKLNVSRGSSAMVKRVSRLQCVGKSEVYFAAVLLSMVVYSI